MRAGGGGTGPTPLPNPRRAPGASSPWNTLAMVGVPPTNQEPLRDPRYREDTGEPTGEEDMLAARTSSVHSPTPPTRRAADRGESPPTETEEAVPETLPLLVLPPTAPCRRASWFWKLVWNTTSERRFPERMTSSTGEGVPLEAEPAATAPAVTPPATAAATLPPLVGKGAAPPPPPLTLPPGPMPKLVPLPPLTLPRWWEKPVLDTGVPTVSPGSVPTKEPRA